MTAERNEEKRVLSFKKIIEIIKPQLTIINCMAALVFLVIVVSGACFFMVLVRWIKPSGIWPDTADNWYEVNSQILNACFTLLALVTHPYRIALIYWTLKWRKAQSKQEKGIWAAKIKSSIPDIILFPCNVNSTSPSQEIVASPPLSNQELNNNDIEVVVIGDSKTTSSVPTLSEFPTPPKTWYAILLLLNLNCIFQYPITIVMWMYIGQASIRPPWVVGLFLPLSFLCGFASGIWPQLLQRDRKKKLQNSIRGGSPDTAVAQ